MRGRGDVIEAIIFDHRSFRKGDVASIRRGLSAGLIPDGEPCAVRSSRGLTRARRAAMILSPVIATLLVTGAVSSPAHLDLGPVRATLAEHGGRELHRTGDGLIATFSSAVAAVQCAVALQRTADRPLRV